MHRAYPSETVCVAKNINPLTRDVTTIIKNLGALKKPPILIFDRPLSALKRTFQTGDL